MKTCRILAGMIYARDTVTPDLPFLPIGNAQATIAIEEETQELPDYTNPAGGNACSVRDISGVALTLTMYDFKPENIALAVFGEVVPGAGAVVADEAVQVFAGGALTPLAHIPTPGTVVVNVAATAYDEGTDYVVKGAGFVVVAGSALETAINAVAGPGPKFLDATVDYTWAADVTVEALVTSGKVFELMIDGTNKASNNSKEVWHLYKVQFGPTAGLNVITREFGSMEVNGEVLADITKPPGVSQYFTVKAPAQ